MIGIDTCCHLRDLVSIPNLAPLIGKRIKSGGLTRQLVSWNFPCHHTDDSTNDAVACPMDINRACAAVTSDRQLGVSPRCQKPLVSSLGFVEIEARIVFGDA